MKKRVAIIGGGIAGLGAARELLQKGYAVTVLEAKERLGGRMHTVHHGTMPIELGAEFLHGESKVVSHAIQSAGLETYEVSSQHRVFENGKFRQTEIWEQMSRLLHRVNPRDPDCSFQQFLGRQKLDERDRAQALAFVQGFHAAYPDRIGAHALLRGEVAAEKMQNSEQKRITAGYSALVDFMAEEIRSQGATLLTGTTVRCVEWERGKASVYFQRGSVSEYSEAEAVVVTLPLGVLKSSAVKFNPPLTDKHEAISELQFGNVVKVIFVFRERWWSEKDFGFIQALDEAIPTWWSDPRGPILVGWAGGPKADALVDLSPPQLEQLGLKILEKIFGVSALLEKLVESRTHNWARDPHVLGAYSYIPPNGLELPKLLGAPMNETLFFAGEATVTDAQTGTVFSAFETGLRAAKEIAASSC